MSRDVTEEHDAATALVAAEAELRASEQELRDLAGSLMTAQEDERARVSSELDVGVTQELGVVAFELAEIERSLPGEAEVARTGVASLQRRLAELAEETYRISRRLHPAILDDVGLLGAIEAECATLLSTSGVTVITRLEPTLDRLPPDISLCFFRVAQEALHNLARHARVERASLELSKQGGYAELRIEDSGVGFDLDEVGQGPGLGLASMRERLHILGGHLSVTSSPAAGTRIEARMSLPRAPSGAGEV